MVVGNRFTVGKKVGHGSFGEIRIGRNIQTNETVVIKLEPMNSKVPTLPLEFRFYNFLSSYIGNLTRTMYCC